MAYACSPRASCDCPPNGGASLPSVAVEYCWTNASWGGRTAQGGSLPLRAGCGMYFCCSELTQNGRGSVRVRLKFQKLTDAKVKTRKRYSYCGIYYPLSQTIVIDSRLPYTKQVVVFFHELGHHECSKKRCSCFLADFSCEYHATKFSLRELRKRRLWSSLVAFIRWQHSYECKSRNLIVYRSVARRIRKTKEFQSALKACCGAGYKVFK